MKLALAILVATSSLAHADDDAGMQIMVRMMRCPASRPMARTSPSTAARPGPTRTRTRRSPCSAPRPCGPQQERQRDDRHATARLAPCTARGENVQVGLFAGGWGDHEHHRPVLVIRRASRDAVIDAWLRQGLACRGLRTHDGRESTYFGRRLLARPVVGRADFFGACRFFSVVVGFPLAVDFVVATAGFAALRTGGGGALASSIPNNAARPASASTRALAGAEGNSETADARSSSTETCRSVNSNSGV